jgi:hypothetical protein
MVRDAEPEDARENQNLCLEKKISFEARQARLWVISMIGTKILATMRGEKEL